MAVREILLLGESILRERAEEVTTFDAEMKQLVRDMFDTMLSAEGAGLAAPQVGVSQRIIVAEVMDEAERELLRVALINPRIVEESPETDRASEGCLSVPGVTELVTRPAHVVIEGLDPEGNPTRLQSGGLLGRVLQHEVDHLNGVLFFDRISPIKRRILLKKYRKLEGSER